MDFSYWMSRVTSQHSPASQVAVTSEAESTRGSKLFCWPSDPGMAIVRNIDIMENIFGELYSPVCQLEVHERIQLVQMALTSKCFFEPAMNTLWRTLHSLAPVLSLLPTALERENDEDIEILHFTATKSISEQDLAALDRYTFRVRNFHMYGGQFEQIIIPSHVLFSLQELRRFRLFPCLKALTVLGLFSYSGEDWSMLFLFPTKTLSSALFSGIASDDNPNLSTFLGQLPRLEYQSLAKLTLDGSIQIETLQVLRQFSQLATLKLDLEGQVLLTPNTLLMAISQIVKLETLSLICLRADLATTTFRNGSNFPSQSISTMGHLRNLEVEGEISSVCCILEVGIKHMPHLAWLSLDIRKCDNNFDRIEACLRDATVRALDIESVRLKFDVFPWNRLEAIQNWKKLKDLQLHIPNIVVDSRRDPWLFTSADNCLEVLELGMHSLRHTGLRHVDVNLPFYFLEEVPHWHPKLAEIKICMQLGLLKENSLDHLLKKRQNSVPPSTMRNSSVKKVIFLPPLETFRSDQDFPTMYCGVLLSRYLKLLFPGLKQVNFPTYAKQDWCKSVAAIICD